MKLGEPLSPEESQRLMREAGMDPALLGEYKPPQETRQAAQEKGIPLESLPTEDLMDVLKQVDDPDSRKQVLKALYPGPPDFLERVAMGGKKTKYGVQQAAAALKDVFLGTNERQKITEKADRELADFDIRRGETGFDPAMLLGEVAAGLPLYPLMNALPVAALASKIPAVGGLLSGPLASQMVSGAGAGAVGGALAYVPEGQSRGFNAALGAGIGAAMPPLIQGGIKAASAIASPIANKVRSVMQPAADDAALAAARSVPTVRGVKSGLNLDGLKKAAQEQLDTSGQISQDVLTRKARLNALGFADDAAPTVGQLTRYPPQYAMEQNLKNVENVGEDLLTRFDRQRDVFNTAIQSNIGKTGANLSAIGPGADEYIGQNVIKAVNRRYNVTNKVVNRLYNQARSKYGNIGGVTGQPILEVNAELAADVSLDPVTKSVSNKMKQLGLVADDGLTGKTLTISEAEGFRKFINGLSNQGGNRYAKKKLVETLDDEVFSLIGDEGFNLARSTARQRFQEFENKLASKIIAGTYKPSDAINTLRNAPTDHVIELRDTLLKSGAQGQQAWNDIRGQLIYDIAEKGGGAEGLTKQFAKQIDRLGDYRLKTIFPESYTNIKELRQAVLDLNVAPRDAAINRSYTTIALANMLQKTGIPGLSSMANVAKNLQQSSAVRKSLSDSVSPILAKQESRQSLADLINNALYNDRFNVGQYIPGIAGFAGAPKVQESLIDR